MTTCQICGRAILTSGGRIASHTRIDGFLTIGACPGSGHPPLQQSRDALATYIEWHAAQLEHQAADLAFIPRRAELVVDIGTTTPRLVPVKNTMSELEIARVTERRYTSWPAIVQDRVAQAERTVTVMRKEQDALHARYALWPPQ